MRKHRVGTPTRGRSAGEPTGRRRDLTSDRGDSSLLLVGVLVAAILAVGLVVDGGARLRADDEAQWAAEQAARAGGQQVSVGEYLDDRRVVLNSSMAFAHANESLQAGGVTGTVRVEGNAIVIETEAKKPTIFLAVIGISDVTGHGRAEVVMTRGITEEGQ